MNWKYLVYCEYGASQPEKATIAFTLAFTSSKTNPTAVFATADAVNPALKHQRPNIVADGYEPLNGLIDGFIENGGSIRDAWSGIHSGANCRGWRFLRWRRSPVTAGLEWWAWCPCWGPPSLSARASGLERSSCSTGLPVS